MTGGFSSSLISGYSTFLRLRSLTRSCEEERGSGGGRVGRGQPPSETARRRGTRAEVRGRGRRGGRGAGARGARSRASTPRASRFRVQGFGGSILRRTMRGAHLLGPRLRVVLGRLGVDVRGGADGEGGGSADDEGHVSWERADARGAFLSGSGASAPRARTGKSEARDVVVAPSGPEKSTISTVCDPRRSVDHRRSTPGDGSSRPIESTDFAAISAALHLLLKITAASARRAAVPGATHLVGHRTRPPHAWRNVETRWRPSVPRSPPSFAHPRPRRGGVRSRLAPLARSPSARPPTKSRTSPPRSIPRICSRPGSTASPSTAPSAARPGASLFTTRETRGGAIGEREIASK